VDTPGRRCPSGCPAGCPSSWPVSSLKAASVRRGVHRADALTAGVRGVHTAVQPGGQRARPTLAESAGGSAAACPHALRGSRPAGGSGRCCSVLRTPAACPSRCPHCLSALPAPRPRTGQLGGHAVQAVCPSPQEPCVVCRAWTSGGRSVRCSSLELAIGFSASSRRPPEGRADGRPLPSPVRS